MRVLFILLIVLISCNGKSEHKDELDSNIQNDELIKELPLNIIKGIFTGDILDSLKYEDGVATLTFSKDKSKYSKHYEINGDSVIVDNTLELFRQLEDLRMVIYVIKLKSKVAMCNKELLESNFENINDILKYNKTDWNNFKNNLNKQKIDDFLESFI